MHWGIIFTLTPLVLVLAMFFTTLHSNDSRGYSVLYMGLCMCVSDSVVCKCFQLMIELQDS